MSTLTSLTLAQIGAAVDAAYAVALAQNPPQKVTSQQIGTNASLRTDLYIGPKGSGLLVVATVDLGWRTLVISRQHGPETDREKPAPTLESLIEECRAEREKAYADPANGCDVKDVIDAETKMASSDPALEAAGAQQKSAALAKRLQIKASIPKPQ